MSGPVATVDIPGSNNAPSHRCYHHPLRLAPGDTIVDTRGRPTYSARVSDLSDSIERKVHTVAKAPKFVFFFGAGKAEGQNASKLLLGGKGAGLAEMTHIGLPVPGGFTITTQACAEFIRSNNSWPRGLEEQVDKNLKRLERVCNKKLGGARDPLLISVRSGAAVSMPGMMETILNLGLNDESVEGLARVTGNRRFAFDAYRRLIMMYGTTAQGIERSLFDDAFDRIKEHKTRWRLEVPHTRKIEDTEVNDDELVELVAAYKTIYSHATGQPFPQDPLAQLRGAINAVFGSWMGDKAVTYRRVEKISGLEGTAVNICQMVYGNLGDDSGTGVCFTRDPSTGENEFYGDLLINAQGEDVVAGIRTPLRVAELSRHMPEAWDQLLAVRTILESHYRDMQDLEFTIERGTLYMLQCRTGKRSPAAAFRIAVEHATMPLLGRVETNRLVKRGHLPRKYAAQVTKPILTKEEAIGRITAADVERLFYPVLDSDLSREELASRQLGTGINAVPGAACGEVVFHPADAERRAADGSSVILVRKETSPEDVGGMHASSGILTATGGKTSHAAVVARGWGKCCIVGCDTLSVDEQQKTMQLNGRMLREGDTITLDGSTGTIYDGSIPLVMPTAPDEYKTLLGWCDETRRLAVRTNADTPADAHKAIELGAEGIGLCRTEHMFFETEERRLAMQEMIVADNAPERRRALDKLQPFQKQDFLDIFRAMDGKPVTIRLIDPPLHEFLPHDEDSIQLLARYSGISTEQIRARAEQLHESNPMLGHRGCRLCITYPEILEMQVSAIIEAAVEAVGEGVEVLPEIMIPLTIDAKELNILTDQTRAVADAILDNAGIKLGYLVGTMIETPRAALLADRIADVARFISFGTNDLTQTAMGLSRDDAGRFLPAYVDQDKHAIFAADPFDSLDVDGVGQLVAMAVNGARAAHPTFKLGVCGEHGGDPDSIRFFHGIGLNYVSCSPLRVPIARLAAAHAVLEERSQRPVKRKPKKAAASPKRAVKKTVKAKKKSAPKKAKKKAAAKKVPKQAAPKKATKKKTVKSAKRKAATATTKRVTKKKAVKKAKGTKKKSKRR